MSDNCLTCGGLIAEEGVVYGYAGKFCLCIKEPQICRPSRKEAKIGQTICIHGDPYPMFCKLCEAGL